MLRLVPCLICALMVSAASASEDSAKPPDPLLIPNPIPKLRIRPSGFLEAIGEWRSQTTPDTISTHFGNYPLADTPGENLGSINHSRLMLKADMPVTDNFTIVGYLESDFLNPNTNQSPYRWRQYWLEGRIGRWEISGGREWGLLRPNRQGIESDREMMNTFAIEPAYHVGLVGSRTRQLRLARTFGKNYKAAFTWQTDGAFTGKIVHDSGRLHLEAAAMTGHYRQRGLSFAPNFLITKRVRIVTQQYWGHRSLQEALGVVPKFTSGSASLVGVEAQLQKNLEIYSYHGLVYASRSNGNRFVHESSAGISRRFIMPSLYGSMMFGIEFSHLDRAVWPGGSAPMDYIMYRFRYTFN